MKTLFSSSDHDYNFGVKICGVEGEVNFCYVAGTGLR